MDIFLIMRLLVISSPGRFILKMQLWLNKKLLEYPIIAVSHDEV